MWYLENIQSKKVEIIHGNLRLKNFFHGVTSKFKVEILFVRFLLCDLHKIIKIGIIRYL